jgi:hypothetical protein
MARECWIEKNERESRLKENLGYAIVAHIRLVLDLRAQYITKGEKTEKKIDIECQNFTPFWAVVSSPTIANACRMPSHLAVGDLSEDSL